MNKEQKQKRCVSCGRRLLDEKIPFCKRCRLEGRNTILKIGGTAAGTATFVAAVNSAVNGNSNSDDLTGTI